MDKEQRTCFASSRLGLAVITVPKCATTSLVAALLQAEGVNTKHLAVEDIHRAKRPFMVAPDEAIADGLFLATFVRHPVDRIISVWRNRIAKANRLSTQTLFRRGFRHRSGFGAFLRDLDRIGVDADLHVMPQARFVAPEGRIIADYIGRVETFTTDWARLQDLIAGLPRVGTPKNSSAAVRAPQVKANHLDIIGRLYEVDFRLFGYEARNMDGANGTV